MQQQGPTSPASKSQIAPDNVNQNQGEQSSQIRMEAGSAVGVNEEQINEPPGYKSRLSKLDFNPCCCCTCADGCCNLKIVCLTFASFWLFGGVPSAYDVVSVSPITVAKIISALLWTSAGITLMIGATMCIKNRKICAILCWLSSALNLAIIPIDFIDSGSNSGLRSSASNAQLGLGVGILNYSIFFLFIFAILYYSLCAFAMGLKILQERDNEPAHGCRKMGDLPPFYGSHFPVNGGQFPYYGGQFPYYGGAVPYYGQFPVYGGQFPLTRSQLHLQQQQSQQPQTQEQQQQQQPQQSQQGQVQQGEVQQGEVKQGQVQG